MLPVADAAIAVAQEEVARNIRANDENLFATPPVGTQWAPVIGTDETSDLDCTPTRAEDIPDPHVGDCPVERCVLHLRNG
ncbi:MAG TPA: hypothetical protein PKA88_00425 [Polyangiaceae bacterium]|nr:hypothetical protein [Polyangiaceae bacterium]HMR79290.1 hypothetical protein [Polyangiaceae bacterium]